MKRLLPAAVMALMLHALLLAVTMQGSRELPQLPRMPSRLTMTLQYRPVVKTKEPSAPLPEIVEKKPQPLPPKQKKKEVPKPVVIKKPAAKAVTEMSPLVPKVDEQQIVNEQPEKEAIVPMSEPEPLQEPVQEIVQDAARNSDDPDRMTDTKSPDRHLAPRVLAKAEPMYHLNPPPKYPRLGRRRGWQGTVLLQVFVDEQGMPQEIQVAASSGFAVLDKAAGKAVAQWRFVAGTNNGVPQAMWVQVPVRFELQTRK